VEDYQTCHLLHTMKEILDSKLERGDLDLNTYLNILNLDLKTSVEADPLKILERNHGRFLEKHLAQGNLTHK